MANSSLLKTILHNSIAEGIYNEIVYRQSRYYYFLGRTLGWEDETAPPFPTDSIAYENQTRNEIITMKDIKATDVAFVVKRVDWLSGEIYDQYDDEYSTEVIGVNLLAGGIGYSLVPSIYIGSQGSVLWASSTAYTEGQLLKSGSNYYIVTDNGTTSTVAPTHTSGEVTNGTTSLKWVYVNDGNGTGATAQCSLLDNIVVSVDIISRGTGYTSAPTVIIAGGSGEGAAATAVVPISATGKHKIEDCTYYVITDEFNVYKCLDNNNGAQSTSKPIGTTVDPIISSDGYMWKFLYTVPIALRNKFLTESYMPVVTALKNQFYSSGQIESIRIDSHGSGYTFANITVDGDGYLAADPLYITAATISSPGSGYTAATIIIDPPFSGASNWAASSLYITGQKLIYQNNIYQVAISGTSSATIPPTHKFGIVANGTAALEYIGTTATGVVTLTSGAITGVTLYGMVREVDITNGGSGYTTAPTVNFSGGAGTGANSTAVLQNGTVIKAVMYDGGSNYTSAPTVTFGKVWTASTALTVGQQVYYSDRLYTVTGAGTTNTVAPTHNFNTVSAGSFVTGTQYTISTVGSTNFTLIGAASNTPGVKFIATGPGTGNGTALVAASATNGTATLLYVGEPATGTTAIKYGSGYSVTPGILIVGTNGFGGAITANTVTSSAKLIPILENGELVGVQIDEAGVGYTFANATITGDGTGAQITIDLSPGDINTLQANIELLTIDGRIMNVPVVSGGYGYGTATVTIVGDGTGATAVIDQTDILSGAIKNIKMTNYGSGYRWATAVIDGNGYGATARVIMSPYGGHGRESINNLYARNLMFFTNISNDKNQGFDVNNDYRQLGIIKNPRQYGNTYSLTTNIASACWVVSAVANTTIFPADTIVRISDSNAPRFRIVTNTGTALLLQSLDNAKPATSTIFIKEGTSDTFSATAVTAPTVDKYSGDLMFIDNKQAFTPTEDQRVTLRTVIKF